MDNYLQEKFKGRYRIMAEYDQSTNDWIRNCHGEIDKDYGDIYIKCANQIKVLHISSTSNLCCYIPSKSIGLSRLRAIYTDTFKKSCDKLGIDEICRRLIKADVILDYEVLDFEVTFDFKSTNMDYIAQFIKPQTSGAKKSPFANSNLPKSAYTIPAKDIQLRKSITKIEKGDMKRIRYIANIDKIYEDKLSKKHKEEMKKQCMKFQQYIHSIGMWEDYLKYLKKNV